MRAINGLTKAAQESQTAETSEAPTAAQQQLTIAPASFAPVDSTLAKIGRTLAKAASRTSGGVSAGEQMVVELLEDQTALMKEWLDQLSQTSGKQFESLEKLQTAVNRSMWVRREMIKRFLKERQERKNKN